MRAFQRERVVPLLVFLVVFVTHNTGVMTSYDSRWAIPIARSLLKEGNTDLDEYRARIEANRFYAIERIDGRHYSIYPIGASLVALPVVWALDRMGASLGDNKIERLVASAVVGLTAALLYLIGRQSLGVRGALALVFIFAYGTAAWSTASRALWQHGPSMLMLTLALWLIVSARRRPWLVQFAGLPLAFSYVIRPTDAISIAGLSAVVFLQHRRFFLPYLLWMLPVAVPFGFFLRSVYGGGLPPYYSPGQIGHVGTLGEALLGHLVSPSRGLLVFSPVLALSIYGAYLKLRRRAEPLDGALIAIVALHWLAISSFPIWWGGHSYGYRLFSDMLPYLVYFLIPVIEIVLAPSPGRRRALAALLGGLVLVSALINYRGAHSLRVYGWNGTPVNVDERPSRVWDWSDPQFLR